MTLLYHSTRNHEYSTWYILLSVDYLDICTAGVFLYRPVLVFPSSQHPCVHTQLVLFHRFTPFLEFTACMCTVLGILQYTKALLMSPNALFFRSLAAAVVNGCNYMTAHARQFYM